MKTPKSVTLALLSVATALIILSPTAMAASSSTSLTLTTLPFFNSYVPLGSPAADYGGVISNAGNQHYVIQGGQAAADGWIFSNQISAGSTVNFRLDASVVGLSTSGNGELGQSTGNGKSWGNLQGVSIVINDEIPAQVFPLIPTPGVSPSEVPFYFTGTATVMNHGQSSGTSVPIMIESPYWNPFGGPIVVMSTDTPPSIFLIVTYSVATINWSGVEVDGYLGGMFGQVPVTGGFTNIANANENLVTGTEQDSGQISFYGFTSAVDGSSIAQLTAIGRYSGSTSFSASGGVDCSPLGLPGTCLLTGASSSGTFIMNQGHGAKISGSYDTVWSVPSTFTSTTIVATQTQH